jgi:hypothetical protein
MSKSTNIFTFKTRKPKKHKNAAPQDVTPSESPNLNLTISSISRASPEAPKEPCEDHRPLVDEFLKGFYAKKDIIVDVRYCKVCTFVASNGVNIDRCPVCGQAIRTVTLVMEREVLASSKDAIVEITMKK